MKIDIALRKVTGIYKITNTINNKSYVGSSVDVYQRGCMYKHLIKRNKLHNKHLQSSVEKYGYDNFTFELLDKCEEGASIFDLHQLEQFYINKINPEYNKRTVVDTNHLLSHSQQTKDKISRSLKESFKNGSKVINRIQEHNIKVSLFDLAGNHIQNFPGLAHCADFVKCTSVSVSYAINSKRRRIKNYIVLRTDEFDSVKDFINIPKVFYSKKVTVLDVVINKTIEFTNCKLCAEFIKCKPETVKKYYENGKVWKKKYKIIKYE
jgi:group I intron endonuclease